MKEKLKEGTSAKGQTLSGKTVTGILSYVNFNPVIKDAEGNEWLVNRKSVQSV